MSTKTIAPGSRIDYQVDWAAWLQAGEAISTYTIAASGAVTVDTHSLAGSIITVWVVCTDDVTEGLPGAVDIDIVTTAGRSDVRRIAFRAGPQVL